eukprot:Skav224179  [mRNA]  locus=scaffold257:56221:60355:- [translate_table: standard]
MRDCLKNILGDVNRWNGLELPMEDFDWSSFFETRGIDYKGDEVKTALQFSWANIQPALPSEIGKVPLRDVCTRGAQHYVDNFDAFVREPGQCSLKKSPRVMVSDDDWPEVCNGLVASGLCTLLPRGDVFDTGEGLLLNGLFGVTKDEWSNGVEVYRLIMNLIPLNALCCPLQGDIETLPMWSLMNPFFLQPTEDLLISSEDVRCFFYTMSVPQAWYKYLAFNKPAPDHCLPLDLRGQEVYLASKVLPMGFANSVSLAQHVHRNLVLWSGAEASGVNLPQEELRKDRAPPCSRDMWRIYLDNYDLLEKVSSLDVDAQAGSLAPSVLALRQQYEQWDVPRNMKKAVVRSKHAEVQGAQVDGELGVAFPRESKLLRYMGATLQLLSQQKVTQKQMQVVCGGLVYVSTFRRPLLGSLNAVWRFIESFNGSKQRHQLLPVECRLELARFLCLVPLAKMDFRVSIHPRVTCSDASTTGGGICVTKGTSALGNLACEGKLRGQLPEQRGEHMVLTIGLFDGIGALRVALDGLGVSCIGHISVEKDPRARRVVEAHFPDTLHYDDVAAIDEQVVQEWQGLFSQASIVVIGAGPPCQGVSGLNADRLGALRDQRSSLFTHVRRVQGMVQQKFCWCQVHCLMESVASMDQQDQETMSADFGSVPWKCDAGTMTWCSRPRLYWITWEIQEQDGVAITAPEGSSPGVVELHAWQDLEQVCQEGWTKDAFRFPPYQYKSCNGLISKHDEIRLPSIAEKEIMMGFPLHYTSHCLAKAHQSGAEYSDVRHTLLGNSWSVPVVTWLLGQLFGGLRLLEAPTPQKVMDDLEPGHQVYLQSRLWRLPLRPLRQQVTDRSAELAQKLTHLVSIKGEDVLLSTPSQQMVKYQRLRASVPSKLWHWKIVAGWQWKSPNEHINNLELRAILTTVKWRVERQQLRHRRFLHLTDSLVCMHVLSRGRSSSRKLRATLSRINALLLVSSCTVAERAKQRQKLGSLKNLTVQPATKARYNSAVDKFLVFLNLNKAALPSRRDQLDVLVCEYLEHLWSSGAGRALASDTLAGLQDSDAKLRGQLPGAWRLLKTWSINEIPNRAPPLPVHVVHALAGWAFFNQHVTFGISLLLGFYGMLRTGEILSLRSNHLSCEPTHQRVVVSFSLTKGGKRQGAAESVVLGYDVVVEFLKKWKACAASTTPFAASASKWRTLFTKGIQALGLEDFGFRPYSLRRGGATWWFGRHHSLDKILIQGRWTAPKTARIYINEGLAILAELKLPPSHAALTPYLQVFNQFRNKSSIHTLEPPVGSTGGRGRGNFKSKKRKR